MAGSIFHVNSLREHAEVFRRNSEELCDRLIELTQDTEIKDSGVDMQDYLMRLTLDSFGEIGFGVQLNTIAQAHNDFAIAFDVVQSLSQQRALSGNLWKLREWFFPNRALTNQLGYMNDLVSNIIEQRRSSGFDLSSGTDALSDVLAQKISGVEPYSDEELRDFVMNFLIAGR